MIQIKNIHEKLLEGIQLMLVADIRIGMPYYGNFNLFINFNQCNNLPTCGVNITSRGMQFYYNSEFIDGLTQEESNFILLHEDFHLLFNHPKRTISGQYNHSLANIAQDMIINHIIWEDISHKFVSIPKDKDGKNMTLFVPKEYTGKLIFEELYEWIYDRKQEYDKKQNKEGSDDNDSSGNPKYGPYGKDPKEDGKTIDTYSLDSIFDNLNKSQGQYLDIHMEDEIPNELRETMIKDAVERLQSRGFHSRDVERTLGKLRKKRKDYLKYIKRSVSNLVFGDKKTKTIVRPNRRQIPGIKGNRKIKNKINCILDTSGSMGTTFDKVLEYIYRNDIETNLIECDTEVKWIQNIKNKRKLDSLKIKGLGGTILQPAINLVIDKFNQYNTLIITDGYCDNLNLSKLKGNVLILTIGTNVPISKSNNRVKQIKIESDS